MPSNCVFNFDRQEPIYYGGEAINGSIELQTRNSINCNEIYIEFIGRTKTQFKVAKTHYVGRRSYIKSRTVVFSKGILEPGHYKYNFNLHLPEECPASFKGTYGSTKYKISLVVNRSLAFDNTFHQIITVIRNFNLNLRPAYLIPLHVENMKYLCFWPCSSGPIISTAFIPYGAYAPGQIIHYSVNIENNSRNSDVLGIFCLLKRVYLYKANPPSSGKFQEKATVVSERHVARICSLTKETIQGEILIPSVPPSTDIECLITIYYYLTIRIETGNCHRNPKIKIPIVIGTEALIQTFTDPWNVAATSNRIPISSTISGNQGFQLYMV